MDLKSRKCKPCEGGTKPMSKAEIKKHLKFAEGWQSKNNSILINKKFKDFKHALLFVNKVAKIAEDTGHHPDIYIHNWNQVTLTSSTHAIKGLSINDFILAAKINAIK
jgi:4a-hydroxytetrahydrobiopterin dehydratase